MVIDKNKVRLKIAISYVIGNFTLSISYIYIYLRIKHKLTVNIVNYV